MAKVRTEDKEILLSSGKWGEFVKYRDQLKADGVSSHEANTLALEKYLPSDVVKAVKDAGGKLTGTSLREIKKKAVEDYKADVPKARIDVSVSDADCIRWVADHVGDGDVPASEAPCARAYNLWRSCRNDRGTLSDFWKAYIAMAMKKVVVEDSVGTGETDGQVTLNAINCLLDMAKEAK